MNPAQARRAIDERTVPIALYPAVLDLALSDQEQDAIATAAAVGATAAAPVWTPPQDYQPRPHNDILLRQGTPQVGTAEFKVVVMTQHGMSPERARMTPTQARRAIDNRIVPLAFYPAVLDLALSDLATT